MPAAMRGLPFANRMLPDICDVGGSFPRQRPLDHSLQYMPWLCRTLQYMPLKSVTGSTKQPASSTGQGMPSPLEMTLLARHTR